ncbi:ParA family protein [Fusobacterium gastrosuis]|uniref:ParA family protein n=1 Tax=Fusobacterium gastrosuis TaxID=1755100 RepID=UPI002974D9AC|nr:ParA family protein [Fusobacteriaceae bacterium]MDY5714270.1 ParA family protein [Fusobacterium gastrosuis]
MIILVKNNKGGIGKTFLTSQIAKGLNIAGKKTLIITSDTQNNILNMLWKKYTGEQIREGLLKSIKENKIYSVKLDENLEFIPLERTLFIGGFKEKFNKFINSIKKKYDFILIDSTPVLNLDNVFVEIAEKVIIPITLDELSYVGTVNILNTIPIEKIFAFIINKYENTKIQNKYKEKLLSVIPGENLYTIKKSAEIEKIVDNRKTIWDYENKKIQDIKDEFFKIIGNILLEKEGKNE